MAQPTFTVQWSLFTEAATPQEAVRIAIGEMRTMLANSSAGANRFTVFEGDEDDEEPIFINADDILVDDDVDVWAAFQTRKK